MKQTLIPKLDIKQKYKFNKDRSASLKILSCNNDDLKNLLYETSNNNPLLNYKYEEVDADAFLEYDHSTKNLYEEINEQARLSKYNPNLDIIDYLYESIDHNGYFKENLNSLIKHSKYSEKDIKKHIAIIRTFEPYGIFAFSLADSLKIQLTIRNDKYSKTAIILCDYLEELALNNYEDIIKHTNFDQDTILNSYQLIKTLNPKPLANYSKDEIILNPEFKIEVIDNEIKIKLLNDDINISINNIKYDHHNEELRQYYIQKRNEVNNIINSIKKRNLTLIQIMQYICDIQKEYFINNQDLNYLTLKMISTNTNLHISTISRAISNKSFEYNNKYYPINSLLVNNGTNGISGDSIKNKIKELIDNEDKKHPLSDEKIKILLKEDNIDVSRRLVSKYRESLYIFNSSKRRIK